MERKSSLNWLEADFKQKIPSFEERASIWKSIRVDPTNSQIKNTDRFVESLRACYDNGDVGFFQFSVEGNDHLSWYASRNRWLEINFFEEFFQLPALQEQMKEILIGINLSKESVFNWGSAYTIDGELARVLKSGGAYGKFSGSGNDAKVLAGTLCRSIFEERYEDIQVYENHRAWSSWFHNVAWDYTFCWIDHKKHEISILCATDTD